MTTDGGVNASDVGGDIIQPLGVDGRCSYCSVRVDRRLRDTGTVFMRIPGIYGVLAA